MNNQNELNDILSVALGAIRKASVEVLGLYQNISTEKINYKSDESPLTQADIASNNIIISNLQQHSSYPILSEEGQDDLTRLNSKYVWLVDPLDGTKEFISKNGEFTINIALVENNRPILGVVSVPAKNVIFYAIRGQGAFVRRDCEDKQIYCSKCNDIGSAKLSVSRSHLDPKLKQLLEKHQISNFTPKGSAVKYCSIAEGLVDASIRKTPLMEWDICAADCILKEAGGLITDFKGSDLKYNKKNLKFESGIIASNGCLHDLFLNLIEELR
jgi:3'(2'), 5'-bisphosphate nucleotidase